MSLRAEPRRLHKFLFYYFAFAGIIGTTINNRMRMRELRNLVTDASDPVKANAVLGELTNLIQTQQQHVREVMEL